VFHESWFRPKVLSLPASRYTVTLRKRTAIYPEVFNALTIFRVDGWLLMESIWPTLALCSAYLLFILVIGPKFMEKRYL
jgi:hypothetical protein